MCYQMRKILYVFFIAGLIAATACSGPSKPDITFTEIGDKTIENNINESIVSETLDKTTEGAKPMETTLTKPGAGFDFNEPGAPAFTNASVHDPSVFRVGDTFYVIGSHMASAKTTDLIKWEQVSYNAQNGNKLVPNVQEDFKEAFVWARTATFWAGDIEPMPDGRFFMYYCNCEGSMPLGDIGLAVANHPEGPYENRGMFIKSGMNGPGLDGKTYNATVHPNAVDPHAFFDNDGQFWMVYGSYSGGIFILKMDPETGLPLPEQGYGKKLLGGNHSRIEGPYILYSPETGYYYLFLSFGGLDATGGYNIRVCRSKTPDGPYYDAAGNDMMDCKGKQGSFFDDKSIEPYGTKLMGGYQFRHEAGEPGRTTGYVSPGHNSAYYDAETGKYYLIYHQRFTEASGHEIRVNEMFLNKDGWFAAAPFRYDGGAERIFTEEQLAGSYKIINHGNDINLKPTISITANLNPDRSVSGGYTGTWKLGADGYTLDIVLDGKAYNGRFLRCYDKDNSMWVMAFTALSAEGIAVWGAGVALTVF
jgi:arabinan endo-1,5-alpha-L-arabinosidase